MAIPSHSPLAEADQRLNLDSFAGFNERLVTERTAPMIEKVDATATSPIERPPEKVHEAARPPSSHARPAPRATRLGVVSAPTKTERAGNVSSEVLPHTPDRPETHAAPPAQGFALVHPETVAASLEPSDRPVRRANALPAPAVDEGRTPAPGLARPASARVTERAGPPVREETAEPMLDALSRAMSWVEGPPQRTSERERVEEGGTPAAVARPPFGEASPRRPARAAARGRAPVTHLEIGTIDVEIVTPPKPPPSAPQRSAAKTNGAGSALRQPFGWRQR
jgi:hypothetical protein